MPYPHTESETVGDEKYSHSAFQQQLIHLGGNDNIEIQLCQYSNARCCSADR